ncbi:glycosyltransferase family 87 protein [Breoghania sp.]|uniref:glycosyltransferase family 87 protein n=1 Tax=Breoghania sp. TaxID=2065378 RepID=UPI0029C9CF4A|nr:glycosyltransferase family 87 protein [Breoghania sp.]
MSSIVTKMREGTWIQPDLLSFAVKFALAAYVLAFVAVILVPNPYHVPTGSVLLTDFLSFWAAAREALVGMPASPYDTAAFQAYQTSLSGDPAAFFSFLYPPTFLLLVLPFGMTGFVTAFVAFSLAGLALFLPAMRAIIGTWRHAVAMLAAPMVINTLLHGQNALVSAGLLGLALVAMERRRHFLTGLLIGLLTYKPQLGLMIPVALLAAWDWRAIFGAAVSAVLFALASLAAFGVEPWLAFFAQAHLGTEILENGWVEWGKMVSVYSAARVLGLSSAVAWVCQGAAFVVAVIAVAVVWWRVRDFTARVCVLIAAGLLATPFALTYDLTVLLVPAAFLIRDVSSRGGLPWEVTGLALVVNLGAVTGGFGLYLGLPVAPLLVCIVLALGLARAKEKEADQPAAASPASGTS